LRGEVGEATGLLVVEVDALLVLDELGDGVLLVLPDLALLDVRGALVLESSDLLLDGCNELGGHESVPFVGVDGNGSGGERVWTGSGASTAQSPACAGLGWLGVRPLVRPWRRRETSRRRGVAHEGREHLRATIRRIRPTG